MGYQQKSYKKFIATAATATLVASAIVPVASAKSFSDVTETNDHFKAIDALSDLGVISGYPDGSYGVNKTVTRSSAVKILGKWLVNAQGFEIPKDALTVARFNDLPVDFADKELVEYAAVVKDAGVFTGSNGNLNAAGTLTRQQMAKVLVEAFNTVYEVDLVADLPKDFESKLTDLDSVFDSFTDYVKVLEYFEITKTANNTFNPTGAVTRGQLASFLYRALNNIEVVVELTVKSVDVKDAKTLEVTLSDDSKHTVTLEKALEENKATEVTFTIDEVEYKATVTYVVEELKVESVSAINDKALKVTGEGLAKLKVEDIAVATNTVASIVPATDGKSATINLSSSLIPGQDTKVTVKDAESTKEYTVNYKLEVLNVEFVSATFDDDLANQKVQLKVNGNLVDADYLALSGYSVNFVAVETTKPALTNVALFAGGTTTSSTGILNTGLTVGATYDVEVQVSKAGVATISSKGKVSIANIHAQAQTIDSLRFVNAGTNGAIDSTFDNTVKGTGNPTTDDFFMNSNTVVAGEVFTVNNAVITKSGEKTAVNALTDVKITSSNTAVLSVNPTTRAITAEAAGTAVITVEIGGVTKTHTFTVTNEKRTLTKITPKDSTVNVIKGNATPVNVVLVATDQYGDPFGITTGAASTSTTTVTAVDEVIPTQADGVTELLTPAGKAKFDVDTTSNTAPAKYGTFTVQLLGNADVTTGTGTVYLKNKAGVTLGAFVLNVTEVNNVSNITSTIINKTATGYSSDNSLELTEDKNVRFELATYNSQGIYAGALNLFAGTADKPGPYKIEVVNSDIADVKTASVPAAGTVTAATGETYYEVIAKKAGTTDVLVKAADGTVVSKETITVTNNPYKINNIAWKSVPTIDYATKQLTYEDVLSLTKATTGKDHIVEGVTLNKTTTHKVRIATTSITDGVVTHAKGGLYLDVDGNGTYTSAVDSILGIVVGNYTSGSKIGGSVQATSTTFDVVTGSTATIAGDEATLIFKVMLDSTDATTSVSSTTVNVKVGN